MAAVVEWQRLCGGDNLQIDGTEVVVRLPNQRHHRVRIVENPDALYLSARVADKQLLPNDQDLGLRIWRHNRATGLVGFRIDVQGDLIGEALVPICGLSDVEFRPYLGTLAAECDRFEYLLTGEDRE